MFVCVFTAVPGQPIHTICPLPITNILSTLTARASYRWLIRTSQQDTSSSSRTSQQDTSSSSRTP